MAKRKPIVHRDPGILGGTPVFVGTRVPVTILFEWLEAGHSPRLLAGQLPLGETLSSRRGLGIWPRRPNRHIVVTERARLKSAAEAAKCEAIDNGVPIAELPPS
jgi:hypothetical protein